MTRVFLLLTMLASVPAAHAASPALGGIMPRGGQRGTEQVVLFNGARLADAQEILAYYPGITITKLEVVNDGQVKATIQIAPDCRLGEHAFRVRTASGITEMLSFYVGALPVIQEKEPNGDFNAPQKLPPLTPPSQGGAIGRSPPLQGGESRALQGGVIGHSLPPEGGVAAIYSPPSEGGVGGGGISLQGAVAATQSPPGEAGAGGVTVHGIIENEDVDYFAIDAKKGQRITAEVEGMRLGTTLFDPYVAILDAKRFELAASDDAALLGQDCVASIIAPEDGTYVIQVRESAYGGNGSCHYRLHVGTFPRPLAVLPAGGKLGDEIEVTFLGDASGEFKQKFKLPTQLDRHFGLFAQDAGGIAPSPNVFRLSDVGNVMEVEPNDAPAQATPAELPLAFNGVIAKPGDVDYFRFAAKKGQVFDVHCYARRLRSALDPVMVLSHFNGPGIVGNDDAVGPDSYFRVTIPEDKEYVLSIQDHLGKGGPNYVYRVEFTPVQAKLSITIPKVDIFGYSQERQTIPVPRGNRYATLVVANRADFGGPITLGAEGLPAGLAMHADVMPASVNVTPVVFEAAADAPIGGKLAHLTARHADPNVKIAGGFENSVILVGVGNVGVFWKHDVDRAAVAVTTDVPFKINVVEPKAPLVQNGSMNLKVVAERNEGFKAPIVLQMLFNPPGVGSAANVTIPEGQTEVDYPVNANGGAAVGKWRIAVIAQANLPTGPVWVSSQLATLEIAAPYVTFAMERAVAEQGKPTDLVCKLTHNAPFEGKAKARVLGLPHLVAAPELEFTKDTKELVFPVTTDAKSPPGQHQNVFCQLQVPVNGETVIHNVGGTVLRIDTPPPPKPNQPPPAPAAAAPPKPPEAQKPPEKRLTRLEQLRKEQEEREKAGKQGEKK